MGTSSSARRWRSRDAGIEPAVLGPRDGLAFMSSNAVAVGSAALLVVDTRRLLDAWLSVAALSFEAAGADPIVLDPRIHPPRHRPGQSAVAARMRELLGGITERRRRDSADTARMHADGPVPVQDPYPFRAQPQVDGAVHDALAALEVTVGHELNFAGENALRRRRCRAAQRQPARRAAGQRDRRAAHRAGVIGGADRRPRLDAAGLRAHRAPAVPDPPRAGRAPNQARWCSSTPPTPRSPRSARWSRRWRPRRCRCRAAWSRTRASRRPPSAGRERRSTRSGSSSPANWSSRCARLRLAGLEPARRPIAVGRRDGGARSRARRPAAGAGRRDRPQADRGLGGRAALNRARERANLTPECPIPPVESSVPRPRPPPAAARAR